ncbi:hypothetical protein BSK60_31015, partial [Paenibacillus odorifer]
MSSNTPNLNLLKVNPVTDGNDTFNIDTMLNDNWDKIDTTVGNKVDKVSGKQLSTNDYTTAEKTKLSGVATGANNYTHPTGDGNQHVPATGTSNNGKVLKAGTTAGSISWGNVNGSEVVEDATHRFATDTEKVTWNAKETTTGSQTKADAAVLPINNRLNTESLTSINLAAGQQILNATKNARLQGLKVQGRTLMPLLSDSFKTDSNSDGMADGWAATLYGATPSLVSINGGKAQRITSTAADTGTPRRLERNITVESGKRYVALVDVVTDGTSLAHLAAASGTSTIINATSVTSAATKTHSVKFMPTTSGTIILRLYNYNGLGTVGWVQFDSLRVIEVSASDYISFDSMTSDQIAQRWPFVPPGINGVDGLWVKRYGRNLIPPFSDQAWVLHVYAKVAEPYKLIANPTGSSQRSNITLNVIPGQRYTFSQGDVASTVTYFLIVDTNSTGTILASTNGVTSTSFTAPASGIIYIATTNSTAGSFVYSNPQLELGNAATQFQPREDSLIAFGGVELHANPTD